MYKVINIEYLFLSFVRCFMKDMKMLWHKWSYLHILKSCKLQNNIPLDTFYNYTLINEYVVRY